MSVAELNTSAQVVLDASGNGQVTVGPNRATEYWHVTKMAVLTSTAVKVPSAYVYTDSVSPSNLLDATYTGSQDSTDLDVPLAPGRRLVIRWTGGDVGALATVSIYGQRIIRDGL